MAMQKGRGGMGSHKHGVSGRPPKSPKLRHHLKREAEKDERKSKDRVDWKPSVKELFREKE